MLLLQHYGVLLRNKLCHLRKIPVFVGIATVFIFILLVPVQLYFFAYKNKTTDHPFVLVKTKGRLGNQMFEFACGYTLAKKLRIPLHLRLPEKVIDDPNYPNSDVIVNNGQGDFTLHLFQIPLPTREKYMELEAMAEDESLIRIINDNDIMSGNYPKNKILRIDDYCQSEHMFLPYKDEIKAFFRIREPFLKSEAIKFWERQIEETKKTKQTVCIHIRRGDFAKKKYNLVDMSFYTNGMKEINQLLRGDGDGKPNPPEFFMFSDEIDFLKGYFGRKDFNQSNLSRTSSGIHLKGIEERVILNWVSGSFPNMTHVQDFHLLSKCHHNILSGSSFGWWSAYLNPNEKKIVIAAHYDPKSFSLFEFNRFFQYRHFYYPIEWIVRDASFVY